MSTEFTCAVEVRWADLDQLGHVNNVKYFEYAMEARVQFYKATLNGDSERAVVVRSTGAEYLKPVVDGPLRVTVSVTHIGNTSYRLRHRMIDTEGDLCVVVDAVIVGFDMATQKSRPLADSERAALAQYQSVD